MLVMFGTNSLSYMFILCSLWAQLAQLRPTLWPHGLQPAVDSSPPWTAARRTPLSMGFPRQEYWSWLPFPTPGESSRARNKTSISCIGRQILYHWSTREAPHAYYLDSFFVFVIILFFFNLWATLCYGILVLAYDSELRSRGAMAHGILVLWLEIEPVPPALEAQSFIFPN